MLVERVVLCYMFPIHCDRDGGFIVELLALCVPLFKVS